VTNIRRHERTDCQTEAIIRYRGKSISGKVENLSLKGLFVQTTEKIDIDEQVEIAIYFQGISGGLSFSLQATAVRADERGVGFNFQKIDVDSVALFKTGEIESEPTAACA
jgi:hypothetical protein